MALWHGSRLKCWMAVKAGISSVSTAFEHRFALFGEGFGGFGVILRLAGAGVVNGLRVQGGGEVAAFRDVQVLFHVGDGQARAGREPGGKFRRFRLQPVVGDEAVGDAEAEGLLCADFAAGEV